MLMVLLFPDGRLPRRGWRRFVWLSVLLMLVGALLCAFAPGPIIALGPIHNPLSLLESPPNVYKTVERVVNALMLVAVISLFIRLRRAGSNSANRSNGSYTPLRWRFAELSLRSPFLKR